MKKWIAFLLCCLLPFSATAIELTEEHFDAWYEEMTYLVMEIGNRWIELPGSQEACDYLRAEFEANGFSIEDGTLIELDSYVPELMLRSLRSALTMTASLPVLVITPAVWLP